MKNYHSQGGGENRLDTHTKKNIISLHTHKHTTHIQATLKYCNLDGDSFLGWSKYLTYKFQVSVIITQLFVYFRAELGGGILGTHSSDYD